MKLWRKVINTSGQIVSTIVEYKIRIIGEIAGIIAEAAEKEEVAYNTRIVSKKIGRSISKVIKKSSNTIINRIDKECLKNSCRRYKTKKRKNEV